MPLLFPSIDGDTKPLKTLLGTYQPPQVVSGGGILGAISQAPQLPDAPFQTQDNVALPSALGSVSAPSRSSLSLNSADNSVQAAQDKLSADTPKAYDYKQHGFGGNALHVLGRVGNIAGDILDPAATSLIPNSDLYNQRRLAGDEERLDKATSNQMGAQREADSVDNEQANRALAQQGQDFEHQRYDEGAPQRQATLANSQLENTKTQQEVADLKLNNKPLDAAGVSNLNDIYSTVLKSAGIKAPMFREGMSPTEVQRSVQSLEHISDQGQKDREFRLAQAGLALQRQVANDNRADAASRHEGDTGRKILDKAEQVYRTGSQSADEMQAMIDGARSGNKVFSAALPLEGALAINTSQGVKRINRTEVDQIAGAGSLFDKIHGEIGKLTAGQAIPENILKDQEQLVKLLKNGAYKNYSDTFDSAQTRYGLNNETKLPSPGGSSSSGAPPEGATGKAPGSDGKLHYHDKNGKDLGVA
jgi:hypothetical protein